MSGKYRTISEVMDYGPHITKVILDKGKRMEEEPSAADFTVHVERKLITEDFPWPAFMGERPKFPMSGERTVEAAYRSNADGEPDAEGTFITLCMHCDPRDGLGSTIRFNGKYNVSVQGEYTVSQKDGDVFDENEGNTELLGDLLQLGEHKDEEINLRYSYYEPETTEGERVPLIIWLHGYGEGGNETKIAATGNKVVNFISKEIQDIFGGKAFLLAPQAPTMWMDNGSGELITDGSSLYIGPLERLFRDFIREHPQIDEDRVYLGGDSNGGYMSVTLAIHDPSLYAAVFPVCEARADKHISEEDLKNLASVPTWFTAAKTDDVVPVDEYAVPTYLRLKKAGADTHFTLWDKVLDRSGNYTDEDGTPYEYAGHWSWIPMLNNENRLDYDGTEVTWNGRPVTICEWLAAQKRG